MSVLMPVIPMLVFLLWLGLIIYGIVLATRFVNAVEQIAQSLSRRSPDRPQQ
jgi:Ca2+/Na+ antiporter